MLRFKSLGSGSSGNATVVESSTKGKPVTRLLVDCGLNQRELVRRLAVAGLQPNDIDAIFITHEHGDHIGCARAFALRYRIPVWMSRGTHTAIKNPDFEDLLAVACDGLPIEIGGLQLLPFTVPHDAREPLQLICTDGNQGRLGILTDLGHSTPHVLAHLAGCTALLLESNHDCDLLMQSAYPVFLKERVGGLYGHLSNQIAAEIAVAVASPVLRHLVAAHLSVQNNSPEHVRFSLSTAIKCRGNDIIVATPDEGSEWLQA